MRSGVSFFGVEAREVGLLQRRLHDADQRRAVGRDRQAFHAAVGDPLRELGRQRAVERRQPRDLFARRVEVRDERAVLVRHPERAVGQRDQALRSRSRWDRGGSTLPFRSVIVSPVSACVLTRPDIRRAVGRLQRNDLLEHAPGRRRA